MLAPGPRAAAVGRVSTAPHEVVTTFARAGLALHQRLAEMLDEHPSHRTERRGCGYTQATRFLSTYINQPREPDATTDFGVLAAWPKPRIESLALRALAAGWPQGWRRLDLCDPAILATLTDDATTALLVALPRTLAQVQNAVQHEESRLLADLIRQILAPEPGVAPDMPEMREKPEIGSCSQAEEFFLEIAHGRVRRSGRVNLFVEAEGRPALVETGPTRRAVSRNAGPVSTRAERDPPSSSRTTTRSTSSPGTRSECTSTQMSVPALHPSASEARSGRRRRITAPSPSPVRCSSPGRASRGRGRGPSRGPVPDPALPLMVRAQ